MKPALPYRILFGFQLALMLLTAVLPAGPLWVLALVVTPMVGMVVWLLHDANRLSISGSKAHTSR